MDQAAIAGRQVLRISMVLARESSGPLGIRIGIAGNVRGRGGLNTTDLMDANARIEDLA